MRSVAVAPRCPSSPVELAGCSHGAIGWVTPHASRAPPSTTSRRQCWHRSPPSAAGVSLVVADAWLAGAAAALAGGGRICPRPASRRRWESVQCLLHRARGNEDRLQALHHPRRILLHERPFTRPCRYFEQGPAQHGAVGGTGVVPCLAPPAGARQRAPARALPAEHPRHDPNGRRGAPGWGQDADSAARFLYAWPTAQAFRPLPGLELLPGDQLLPPLNRLLSAFDALKEWHVMLLDPPAARAFRSVPRAACMRRCGGPTGIEAAWLGKGGGMGPRALSGSSP